MDIVLLCRRFSCFCCRITHCCPPIQAHKEKICIFFLLPHLCPTSVELLIRAVSIQIYKRGLACKFRPAPGVPPELQASALMEWNQCEGPTFSPAPRPLDFVLKHKRAAFDDQSIALCLQQHAQKFCLPTQS